MGNNILKSNFEEDYLMDFNENFIPDPSIAALVIVDVQNAAVLRKYGTGLYLQQTGRLDEFKWRFDRIDRIMLPNVRRLLHFFRQHNLFRVFITLGSETGDYLDLHPPLTQALKALNNSLGNFEHEIPEAIEPLDGEHILNKTTFGAFQSTALEDLLRDHGIKHLLFCGLATSSCVESTAREAVDRGYKCIVIEDACVDTKECYHLASLAIFGRLFGHVETTENAISILQRQIDVIQK